MPITPVLNRQTRGAHQSHISCWLCPMHLGGVQWSDLLLQEQTLRKQLSALTIHFSSPVSLMNLPSLQSPRKVKMNCLDYYPAARTLTIVKRFERLVMAHICTRLPHNLEGEGGRGARDREREGSEIKFWDQWLHQQQWVECSENKKIPIKALYCTKSSTLQEITYIMCYFWS